MEALSLSHRSKSLFICTGLLFSRFASSLPLAATPLQNVFDRTDNIALYWGQNSAGASSPPLAQRRLLEYCRDTTADIIPLAFLTQIRTGNNGDPVLNFANQQSDCSLFPGTDLLDCPTIGSDIKTCQRVYGKKILLSIGGATYTDGGFTTPAQAVAAADLLIRTFGPTSANIASRQVNDTLNVNVTNWNASAHGGWQKANLAPVANFTLQQQNGTNGTNATLQGAFHPPIRTRSTIDQRQPTSDSLTARAAAVNRPFGDAVIDGFNLDFESNVQFVVPFARALRARLDAVDRKRMYLTAAPTCPESNIEDDTLLNSDVFLEAVFVQFYNGPCGLQSFSPGASRQLDFDFNSWNAWAASTRTKIFLGVPAGPTAANTGYLTPAELKPVITYSKKFSNFGGVAVWDASQAVANKGFLRSVRLALGSTR